MGCLCLILFNRMQDSCLRFLKCGENQLSSRKAQAVKQAAACLFRIQAYFHGIQDISGVQTDIHLHRRHTADLIAIDDRPLDRGCPTVFWQKRRMDVDTAVFRQVQNPLRQNLAKCNHDDHVRLNLRQFLKKCLILADAHRLIHRDSIFQRFFLDRRHCHRLAASLRLIWLCHHRRYFMPTLIERFQCRNRKIRCSHKYDLHICLSPHSCFSHSANVLYSSSAVTSSNGPSTNSTYRCPCR